MSVQKCSRISVGFPGELCVDFFAEWGIAPPTHMYIMYILYVYHQMKCMVHTGIEAVLCSVNSWCDLNGGVGVGVYWDFTAI